VRSARSILLYGLAFWLFMFVVEAAYGGMIYPMLDTVVFGVVIGSVFTLCWFLTRRCVPEGQLGTGRVFRWLGWSLLSIAFILPWPFVSTWLFPEHDLLWESPYWWLDALIVSVLMAFGLVFLAFATGHALGAAPRRFAEFFRAVKPLFLPGTIAYFVTALPSNAFGNYVDWMVADGAVSEGAQLPVYAASSLVDTVAIVFDIALSVVVFLKADTARTD
jgi:hypothetical protein